MAVPKLIFPPLISCREAVRLCPGTNEHDCGDELDSDLDPNQELCAPCQREEDEMYHQRMLRAEGFEPLVAYPHLTDEGR